MIINFSKQTLIEAFEYCKFNPNSQVLIACRLLGDVRVITRWIYENIPLQEFFIQDFCAYKDDMGGSVKTEIAFYSRSKIIIKTIDRECLNDKFDYIIAEDENHVMDIINSARAEIICLSDDIIEISNDEVLDILKII